MSEMPAASDAAEASTQPWSGESAAARRSTGRLYMTSELRAATGLSRTHLDFYLREGIVQPTDRKAGTSSLTRGNWTPCAWSCAGARTASGSRRSASASAAPSDIALRVVSDSGAAGHAGRTGGGSTIHQTPRSGTTPGRQVPRRVRQHGAGRRAVRGPAGTGPNEKDRRANADLSHVPIGCELFERLMLCRKPNGPSPNRLFA
jgi:hypothetical protein